METSTAPLLRRGKVREVYQAGEHLVIVASDRISAFDCILPTPIPDKGKILTQLSLFWFERTSNVVDNHVISSDPAEYPEPFASQATELAGRSMLCKRAEVVKVECVARGYLAGSGWKEYQKTQTVCGINLPAGLSESSRLPEPIFTPTTKADTGHDMPMTYAEVEDLVGKEMAARLSGLTLALYTQAAEMALQKGVIIADTKFEFGVADGKLLLIDEIFTPDSSRFWDVEKYHPGGPQDSYDKQYVRDYLEQLDWDKTPPAPGLPADVVEQTAAKYREAYFRLTGRRW